MRLKASDVCIGKATCVQIGSEIPPSRFDMTGYRQENLMGDFSANKPAWHGRYLAWAGLGILAVLCAAPQLRAQADSQAAAQKAPPAVGTIKSISGNLLVLKTDGGLELKVQLLPDIRVLRVPPGSHDLKEATAMQLTGLQPGDRVLVRGKPGDEAGTLLATTVVAMKKEDIAEKQAKEREEWQRHGIGGLVKSVDTGNAAITISIFSATGTKDVLIHAPTGTILRRYAPGSVKFDEAKVAPLTEIQAGDQLRARGARSPDGQEFTADEVVSGLFRNVAGTISSISATGDTLTVSDLATKKNVELKVTADSQMRKLPQPIAQRIAMRLKGISPDANGGAGAPGAPGQAATAPSASGRPGAGGYPGAYPGAGGGMGGPPRTGGGDVQQLLSRLPASPLSDFQKGDAVMIVATSGQGTGPATVITLLGGVEPILQGSSQGQVASILSPWSLSQGGAAEAGTP